MLEGMLAPPIEKHGLFSHGGTVCCCQEPSRRLPALRQRHADNLSLAEACKPVQKSLFLNLACTAPVRRTATEVSVLVQLTL